MTSKKKIYSALDMAKFISGKPKNWFILQIVKQDKQGKAKELKLINYARDKDILYDYLMDEENWDWNSKFIFVYSDPEQKCELL